LCGVELWRKLAALSISGTVEDLAASWIHFTCAVTCSREVDGVMHKQRVIFSS